MVTPNTNPIYTVEHQRIAALRATEWRGRYPDNIGVFHWIAAMDPLIKRVSEGGETSHLLDSMPAGVPEDLVTPARLSCAVYNALPSDLRSSSPWPAAAPLLRGSVIESGTCQDSASLTTYWWGYAVYLNHCLVNDVSAVKANLGAIKDLIIGALAIAGIVLSPLGAAIVAASAAFLVIEMAWLVWADSHCGNAGAFIEGTWLSIGTPWVRTVC